MTDNILKDFNPEKLARDNLTQFMLYTDPYAHSPWGWYVLKEFHRKIIEAFERVERGKLKKLMINVPAQHGKSSISSVGYPAWTLGKNMYQNVALASYSAELSEGFSRKTRDLVKTDQYKALFGELLDPNSQSITEWNTIKWGSYRAVGVWGSLTGKTVDKMIIDDPHKDYEEAQSPLIRNKVWNWYTSVPLTRVHWETATIIIMTRWHEDDLCGRLLEKEWDEREVLNIPVFNEDWSVIRPEKHPKELIEKKRQTMGESLFQAMYMWDPINEWGWAFKWEYFTYYDKWEIFDNYWVKYIKDLQVVTFVDPAISQKQTADDTSIVTVGLDKENNNVYVIDVRRWKMLPDEIINNLFNVVNTFHPQKVGIEINSYQKMLEIEIRKEMKKRNNFFLLEWQTSSMNKEAKILSALQPRYNNVAIIHQLRWKNVNELEAQLLKFPNGKHDDIIDALSMAIMMLNWFMKNIQTKAVHADWLSKKDKSPLEKLYKLKRKARFIDTLWV